jgi:fumarate hydratase class II
MSTRIERDSLGEKEVPHDAYYGIQTVRAVENFPVSGLRPYRAFIWAMAAIKRAAAEVNHGLELLDEARARAISNSAPGLYRIPPRRSWRVGSRISSW